MTCKSKRASKPEGWVSVKDALPDFGVDVIVFWRSSREPDGSPPCLGVDGDGNFVLMANRFYIGGGEWCWGDGDGVGSCKSQCRDCAHKVSHWMPIPQHLPVGERIKP